MSGAFVFLFFVFFLLSPWNLLPPNQTPRGAGILEPGSTLHTSSWWLEKAAGGNSPVRVLVSTRLFSPASNPVTSPTDAISAEIGPLSSLFDKIRPNKLRVSNVFPITPANHSIGFDDLLKARLIHEDGDPMEDLSSPDLDYLFLDAEAGENHSSLGLRNLFSLSPLPSPTPSPPSTPGTSSVSLPAFDDKLFSLSPLPSPTPSPPSTPGTFSVSLPNFDDSGLAEDATPPEDENEDLTISRKDRQKQNRRRLRREKRTKDRGKSFSDYKLRKNVEARYIDPAVPIKSVMDMANASVTESAFVGKDNGSGRKRCHKLEELWGESSKYQLKYVPWDGITPTPVVDKSDRIVAVLAGKPDEEWDEMERLGRQAIESRRSRLSIPKNDRRHRRGAFPALRCGVSHGCGQGQPKNLGNTKGNAEVLDELNHLEPFKRLAGFASSVMASWAPDLYGYYVDRLGALHAKHPELKRIFSSSVFAAASYNFGPRTACFKHTDFANLPFGWCAVTAFGSFDPKNGGHLILWDLGLVVEFPPGSTILLPSGVIAHSNVPVSREETRYSFAQYTAGGLFRWVENECQLQEDYYASLLGDVKFVEEKNELRWAFGLSLFSKLKKGNRKS